MAHATSLTVRMSDEDIARIAHQAARLMLEQLRSGSSSLYLTIPEAADLLRCRRQRVDDLLSQRRLTRVKEGARTLIARAELEAYLRGEPTGAFSGSPAGAA